MLNNFLILQSWENDHPDRVFVAGMTRISVSSVKIWLYILVSVGNDFNNVFNLVFAPPLKLQCKVPSCVASCAASKYVRYVLTNGRNVEFPAHRNYW